MHDIGYEGKVIAAHAMKAYRGNWGAAPYILNFGR